MTDTAASATTTVTAPPKHPKTLAPLKGLVIKQYNDPRLNERLKVLDKYLFPVRYSDQHYENLVKNGFHLYNQIAFYNDALVGSLMARLEVIDEAAGTIRLYIMTIGVLKPYRRLGIAARLLQKLIDNVTTKETQHKISHIALNVQVGSDAAYNFYKSFGFEDKGIIKNYYSDLDVLDAHLMELPVVQYGLIAAQAASAGSEAAAAPAAQ